MMWWYLCTIHIVPHLPTQLPVPCLSFSLSPSLSLSLSLSPRPSAHQFTSRALAGISNPLLV